MLNSSQPVFNNIIRSMQSNFENKDSVAFDKNNVEKNNITNDKRFLFKVNK